MPAASSCSSSPTIIDRLLADPRRIVAVRNKLNLGKSV
jgi:hypothetical protein